MSAPRSVLSVDGESPSWAKGSYQPNTKSHVQGGNELNEAGPPAVRRAGRREASGRNASEGIEPRNLSSCRRSRRFMASQTALP